MTELRRLVVYLDAFEIILHNEVHNASNRVSTVGRRGTAGQNFHTLDEGSRDQVDVSR